MSDTIQQEGAGQGAGQSLVSEPGVQGNALQLWLATAAFATCFAMFGSVSAMMPALKERLHLTPLQASLVLALPVILGSIGRIPLGLLTDRIGARIVFAAVLLVSAIPVAALALVHSYSQLLATSFCCGLALASFSVGTGFVARWHAPGRQGYALGIYGAGNIGQSLAAFGAPLLSAYLGFVWGFWFFSAMAVALAVVWLALARNPPGRIPPSSWEDVVAPLRDRNSWLLSLYYFLTFGGFVAMAVYLPTLLVDLFGLSRQDAGLRTAGFVLVATLARPLGGALADKVGGRPILLYVFPLVGAMALLLAVPNMALFTVGALGMAAAVGYGNGAVFKLAPQYFPRQVGAVTGLIGAAGGLGGFFPPLLLGLVRQRLGIYGPGFVALAVFAGVCWYVCRLSDARETGLPSVAHSQDG